MEARLQMQKIKNSKFTIITTIIMIIVTVATLVFSQYYSSTSICIILTFIMLMRLT